MPVELPGIPGGEVAGVVDEVGEGVTDVSVGDEVFGFAVGGGAAERAVLEYYATKPAGLPWAEAAGCPWRWRPPPGRSICSAWSPQTILGERRRRWGRHRGGAVRARPRRARHRHGQ